MLNIIPLEGAAEARTDTLSLLITPTEVISRLLAHKVSNTCIRYGIKRIPREDKEKSGTYYQRLDSEVRRVIRRELKLGSTVPVNYERIILKGENIFFVYLGKDPVKLNDLLEDASTLGADLRKLSEIVISLLFNASLLEKVGSLYNIDASHFNSKIFLAPKPIDQQSQTDEDLIFEAVNINLAVLANQSLVIEPRKVAFKACLREDFMPQTEDGNLVLINDLKHFNIKKSLTATKHATRPYIDFNNYSDSINYFQTSGLNLVKNILSNTGVPFEELRFKADGVLNEFIDPDHQLEGKLLIIDAFPEDTDPRVRDKVHEDLSEAFPGADIILKNNAPKSISEMDESTNYLVVNQPNKKGTSSISAVKSTDSGKTSVNIGEFFKAVSMSKSKKHEGLDFDYYTRLKLERLASQRPLVIQGVNVKVSVSKNGDIATDLRKLQRLTKAIKESGRPRHLVDTDKVIKIKKELWLKESIHRKQYIDDVDLMDGSFKLFYVKKLKRKRVFVTSVSIQVDNGKIKIRKVVRYSETDLSRLEFEEPELRKAAKQKEKSFIDSLYNQSFLILNETDRSILKNYSSISIPNIIGNARFDNVELSKTPDGISRVRDPERAVLPYYINRSLAGQMHHIFLKDHRLDGIHYFVSNAGQPNSVYQRRSLMRCVKTLDKSGAPTLASEAPLTELFFKSLTFDLLNNKDVSKKSLLQKIAELYVEN